MKKNNIIVIISIIIFIALTLLLLINKINNKEHSLIKLTYEEIQEKTKKEESFILVVSQSSCSHCATYKPKLINITKEYNIDIYYIDYDTDEFGSKFLEKYDLDGATPTTIFIEKGRETSKLNRIAGDISEDKIITKFKKMGFIK